MSGGFRKFVRGIGKAATGGIGAGVTAGIGGAVGNIVGTGLQKIFGRDEQAPQVGAQAAGAGSGGGVALEAQLGHQAFAGAQADIDRAQTNDRFERGLEAQKALSAEQMRAQDIQGERQFQRQLELSRELLRQDLIKMQVHHANTAQLQASDRAAWMRANPTQSPPPPPTLQSDIKDVDRYLGDPLQRARDFTADKIWPWIIETGKNMGP